jgi:RNA polymerase sigma factor (sigma-70 family)
MPRSSRGPYGGAPDELLAAIGRGTADDATVRELVAVHATPLVERLVAEAAARGAVQQADAADVVHEATLRLLIRLRALLQGEGEQPITRFEQYVVVVVRHAIEDYRRLLDPLRTRLMHRVRYVLTNTRTLAVWGSEPQVCGLAEWSGRSDVVALDPAPHQRVDAADAPGLRRLVVELVRAAGAPVEVNGLIDVVATAVGLGGERFTSTAALREVAEVPRVGDALESRQYLRQLWEEIRQLPVRQRRALLLNLRLDDGDSVARALAALGIASASRLADALELPLGDLLAWWNELPLPDERIAASLQLTRQQVINLRKSARERLARRMGRLRPRRGESR